MRILITNDDCIYADGIIPFAKWAQKLGDVTVIAPKVEQSGKSHGIEIHKPFEVKEIDLLPGVRALSVDSTPADCIRYAILGEKINYDLVFSGVNRGFNLGQDMIYSGTMGAATEAAYLGYKAIAFSTDVTYYPDAIKHLDDIWNYICDNKLLDKHNLYNVNIPENPDNKILITKQGGVYYSDDFISTGEKDMFRAQGRCAYKLDSDLSYDTNCVMNGHISISPISINRTDMNVYNELTK